MKIQNKKTKRPVIYSIIVIAAVCILAVIAFIYVRHGSSQVSTSPTTNTPKPQSDINITNGQATTKPTGSDTATTTPPPSNTTPITPTGTFISNHRPNLSGQPAPNSLNSTCITTPGVTCIIQFTMNNQTKSLPSKVTDANGIASWDWTLQDIDLGEGSWKVTAVAKNGTLTSSADDGVALEVRP